MRSIRAAILFPITLSLLFLGASASSAHAYLDAGTGSMILQVLLGGVAGLAIAANLYWYQFLPAVGIKRDGPEPAEANDDPLSGDSRADR